MKLPSSKSRILEKTALPCSSQDSRNFAFDTDLLFSGFLHRTPPAVLVAAISPPRHTVGTAKN